MPLKRIAGYSVEDVRNQLKKAAKAATCQSALAAAGGYSRTMLNDVIAGRKAPPPAILETMGLVKVTLYARKADVE